MSKDPVKENQLSLSMLLSNLPGMVYRCLNDQNWTLKFASEGCLELTGYKPSDLIGNQKIAYNDLIHPAEQEPVREQVQKALSQRKPFRVFYRLKPAKGGEKWVWEQGQGIFSEKGELLFLEGFVTDVSDRLKTEHALRDSEARLRAIVETAVDGIITIDEQGLIESFNRASEKLFGYLSKEVIGKNIKMLMPSPYHEEHDSYLENYVRTGEKKIIGIGREVVGKRKDGTTFPLYIAVGEIRLENRRIFTGTVHDLTEQKSLQQQILQSERLAVIGKMAAKVAHEVRNPLSSISLNAEMLEEEIQADDSADNKEAKSLLRSMIREIDRVTSLTDEYLQFSRLPESQPIEGNLNHLIKEMMELLVEELKQKKIKLNSENLGKELRVPFDRAQLRRVLLNIIRNAIESMPDQGKLNIWTGENGEMAIIEIRDSGHGIPDEKVNDIFNPFFTTKDFGTGLGLAISQQIIHEHQGSIYCDSKIGQGTTFRIELPLNKKVVRK